MVLTSFSHQKLNLGRHLAGIPLMLMLALLKQLQRLGSASCCPALRLPISGESQGGCQRVDRCTLHMYTGRFRECAAERRRGDCSSVGKACCTMANRLAVKIPFLSQSVVVPLGKTHCLVRTWVNASLGCLVATLLSVWPLAAVGTHRAQHHQCECGANKPWRQSKVL